MALYRNVIKIKATDTPNVQLGLYEESQGLPISHTELIPGILSYEAYLFRRNFWKQHRQRIGLDAEFPEEGSLMFNSVWIKRSNELHMQLLKTHRPRKIRAIGVDPGEGVANTVLTGVDEFGVVKQAAKKTTNTAEIPGIVAAWIREHKVPPGKVAFDIGGGGKQHADRLRAMGFPVRTVAFGESASPLPQLIRPGFNERLDQKEERYVYINRRVQMYHAVSLLGESVSGFAIPEELEALVSQLKVVPLEYDDRGRMLLPPKEEMYAESPDEADSAVLGVWALQNHDNRMIEDIKFLT